MQGWAGTEGDVALAVTEQNERLLDTYRADPGRLEQDANIERSIAEGAYAKRQLFELLQNAADAMRDTSSGRCEVVLTDSTLYVANSGDPISVEGALTLLATHKSAKRDEQIGRFGLGFKSVLAVSDSPRVFSRSGSFAFDKAWSDALLSHRFPGRSHYPITRMAQPVDPYDAIQHDVVLKSMATWAATVVALPLKSDLDREDRNNLAESVDRFPAEFLLFSRHVERLDLEDRSADRGRLITLSNEGEILVLNDAGKRSAWVVSSRSHTPSKEAFAEGGYQAARESVEVTWAAPVEGKQLGVGLFWAFFPTATMSTLSGIVNAPWKLADDRASLLAGTFNEELLTGVLPSLVAETLPKIFGTRGAGSVIDILPARGDEARSVADDLINRPIMKAVAACPSVPSLGGMLRHPTRIRLHPKGLRPEELEIWRAACQDPERWVDHSLNSAERWSKVLRLLQIHQRTEVTLKEWVEHLVKDGSVEGSAAAVRLVAMIRRRDPSNVQELAKARVLLLEDGSTDACRPGQIFLPTANREAGRLYIDSRLAGIPEVVTALESLGIRVLDSAGALRSELTAPEVTWDNVWVSSRRTSRAEAESIFRDVLGDDVLRRLRVRTRAGRWQAPGRVFLPGKVIGPTDGRDAEWLVDPMYHGSDRGLLESLGLVSEPQSLISPPDEPWRVATEVELRDVYRKRHGLRSLADADIDIDPGRVMWPLQPLQSLSPEGRAALTHSVISRIDTDHEWSIRPVRGGSASHVVDPTWGYLRKHGYLRTEVGIQPVSRCLKYSSLEAPEGEAVQPLPYAEGSVGPSVEDALRLYDEPTQIRSEDWADLIDQARGWAPERRTLLYAWAAYCGQPPPERIRAARGQGFIDLPPNEVAVASSAATFQSLASSDCPALLASSDDAAILIEQWGLAVGEELLEETIDAEPGGEAFLVVDRFPPLKLTLGVEWHDVQIQPCDRLELLTSTPTGQKSRPLSEHRDGKLVFTTGVSDRDILLSLGRALDQAIRPEVVVRRMEEQRKAKRRVEIAETEDVLSKLVLAIGVEEMQKRIPAAALSALATSEGRELSDRDIARLALSVDGYRVLQEHSADLTRNGLTPPSQWAGGSGAREWVRDLGFPAEFAGFPGDRRDAEIEVEGPPILGDLHDYQDRIASKIKGLLAADAEVRRGLVALPTGAGKTRVAVQALVEHIGESDRPTKIVWVAETDELCEQAVQTWSQVWRAKGKAGVPLTVSRLWGSNKADERYGHQVVVATIAKLDAIDRRGEGEWDAAYSWLTNPSIIVVDEAHRSIGPQYTGALSRLGGSKRVADMTTPLLGLTATPFRGWNERETDTLAGRYHRNQLDADVFPGGDVYGFLQDKGVLARVNQTTLKGAELAFTDDELRDARAFNRVPDEFESRLGRNEQRNNTIVESMLELPHNATALLFATSVENARVLAALLSYHGVEARAVSGGTDPAARRRYIEDFKARDVRVLTNYNVFTEGFDVPSVDAVYITRPTFSPNIYQQMIGRGLRGPLNGGKPEVLVVNVEDNITNYGEAFAFRHFEHLWNGSSQR